MRPSTFSTLGQTLESQPEVEQAYRDGKLSPSRAKLVANAVKANPGREGELVNGAEKDTLRQLKERCLRAKAEGRSPRTLPERRRPSAEPSMPDLDEC